MGELDSNKEFIKNNVLIPINKYIIGDLSVLDTIQPSSEGLNSCAVPTAMLILSTIEFLGFLISDNGKIGKSETNIENAFSYNNYFPPIYKIKSKIFSVVYRHGMMHSSFPKHSYSGDYYALCKSNSSDLFIQHDNGSYIINSLNVNVLSKDFQVFFKNLKNELETTSDSNLINMICDKFKKSREKPENDFFSTLNEPRTTIPPLNYNN